MSVSNDGKRIVCDGECCVEMAPFPVRRPLNYVSGEPKPTENWLFVNVNGTWRHYCPKCVTLQIQGGASAGLTGRFSTT